MLRRDVIEAVENGQFHVYPIASVDQAIELLTGVPAGALDEAGRFPPGSVNERVDTRLRLLAETRRQFERTDKEKEARGD